MEVREKKTAVRHFGGGVRTDRLGEMQVFRKRDRFRDSVDRRARGEDEALDAGNARSFKKVQRPEDIRIVVKLRMKNRWAHPGPRRQMRDDLDFIFVKQRSQRRVFS